MVSSLPLPGRTFPASVSPETAERCAEPVTCVGAPLTCNRLDESERLPHDFRRRIGEPPSCHVIGPSAFSSSRRRYGSKSRARRSPASCPGMSSPPRVVPDFLRLDSGLLEVAAETSPALPAVTGDARALARHIAKLPVSDKDRLLVLVAEDQAARARMELLGFRPDPDDQRGSGPRRTVAELLDTAGAADRRRDRQAEVPRVR